MMNKIPKGLFQFKQLTHSNKYNLYVHEYQAHDMLKKYNVPLVNVILYLSSQIEF